jgi:hypothetical protein
MYPGRIASTPVEPSADVKCSPNKISLDKEDHPVSTRVMGTILIVCTPTINNITVNCILINGGAGLNIISVEIFKRMQVPYTISCQPGPSSV